jgi:hypothetical protein
LLKADLRLEIKSLTKDDRTTIYNNQRKYTIVDLGEARTVRLIWKFMHMNLFVVL